MNFTARAAAFQMLAWLAIAGARAAGDGSTSATLPGTGTPAAGSLVVIGASASAGFTISEPFGGPQTAQYRLSRYLDAALAGAGVKTTDLASTPFFMNPMDEGKRQVDQALELKPRAAIAVDFLFWFCYGNVRTEPDRMKRFEQGLAFLERLKCPLVVGDIPDASAAVGGMLSAASMPKPETIAAANRRLKEWAAAQTTTGILSLSEFMQTCQADRGLTVHGQTWAEGQTLKLLQPDRLHPARHGCAALALAVADILSRQSIVPESEVRWDANAIYNAVAAPSPTKPTPAATGRETAPAAN